MGLLNKFFGKKNSEEVEKALPGHVENWDFYLCNIDDNISSIYLDLGLHNIAPINNKNTMLWISVKMQNPNEAGLSSSAECDVLDEIENSICNKILNIFDSIYIGRITSDNHRDFNFYLNGDNLDFEIEIKNAMSNFPDYEFAFGTLEDENWEHYFDFMYPNPSQIQCMKNRRVVEVLEENGDDLTQPREVDHWIYFNTIEDRTKYVEEVKNEGFTIVNETKLDDRKEMPYSLQISRFDNVDLNSVNDYVLYLWALAEEYNGDYDGWETSIEK
ncbi:MAG: hypothetical protein RLZZ175_2847 [Bacteroidota bacterium]|jgi:uncharacterized protein (TIGR01619 family)